jgi:hypothetical protein
LKEEDNEPVGEDADDLLVEEIDSGHCDETLKFLSGRLIRAAVPTKSAVTMSQVNPWFIYHF